MTEVDIDIDLIPSFICTLMDQTIFAEGSFSVVFSQHFFLSFVGADKRFTFAHLPEYISLQRH